MGNGSSAWRDVTRAGVGTGDCAVDEVFMVLSLNRWYTSGPDVTWQGCCARDEEAVPPVEKGKEKAASASDNTEKAAPFVGTWTSGLLLLRCGAIRLFLRRPAPELSGRGSGDDSMSNLTRFRAGGSGVAAGASGALALSNGALMRVAMLAVLQLFR